MLYRLALLLLVGLAAGFHLAVIAELTVLDLAPIGAATAADARLPGSLWN